MNRQPKEKPGASAASCDGGLCRARLGWCWAVAAATASRRQPSAQAVPTSRYYTVTTSSDPWLLRLVLDLADLVPV